MSAPSTRANGGRITAGWFNDIKTWVQGLIGAGSIEETSFTIANNQSTVADVTGLVFVAASYRSAIVEWEMSRKTDTASSEKRAMGRLRLAYRAETAAWEILSDDYSGDEHGVTFSITAAGQVQYQSTSISGSNYAGTMKFRARSFNA